MRSNTHLLKMRSQLRLNRTNDHRNPREEPGSGIRAPGRPPAPHGFSAGLLSIFILCFLLAAAGNARAQETGQLAVTAAADDSYSGILRVRLARNEREYTGESQPYNEEAVPMNGESATVTFHDVEPGQYAVASYLDENEDGELNTNLFGAPREPIGFSRNPRIGMSRPTFSETVFEYTGGDLSVNIELKD